MEKIEGFLKWWPVILIFGQMLLGWMQWKLSQRFATKSELDVEVKKTRKHDSRISNMEGKILVVETQLNHMPTSKDITALKEAIAAHTEIYRSLRSSIKRVEDYLLTQKGQS